MMVNPTAAAEHITGIAAAEVIEERRRLDAEISAVKREGTSALQDLGCGLDQHQKAMTAARARAEA